MSGTASRKGLVLLLAAVLLIGGFAVWYVVVPRVALARMALAIEARDHEAVSRYIDYPSLRESLRTELGEVLHARAAGDRRAALGAAVGQAALGPLIDRIVTPEGVRDLMRGGDALARVMPRDMMPESGSGPPDLRIRGKGLTEVHVITSSPSGDVRLMFERTLLSVRLVGVQLPR